LLIALLVAFAEREGIMSNFGNVWGGYGEKGLWGVLTFIGVKILRKIWKSPSEGWGITDYGIGYRHAIELWVILDPSPRPMAKTAMHVAAEALPIKLRITNLAEKRIRIREIRLFVKARKSFLKESYPCSLVNQDGVEILCEADLNYLDEANWVLYAMIPSIVAQYSDAIGLNFEIERISIDDRIINIGGVFHYWKHRLLKEKEIEQ